MNAFFKVNLKMEGSDGERGSSIRKDGMRSLIDVAAARSGTFPASFCVLQQSEVFFLMFALAGLLGDGEEGRESRLCCGVRGYRGGKRELRWTGRKQPKQGPFETSLSPPPYVFPSPPVFCTFSESPNLFFPK